MNGEDEYRTRLEKLAEERTNAARLAAEEESEARYEELERLTTLADDGFLAMHFRSLFKCLASRQEAENRLDDALDKLHDMLICFLLYAKALWYDSWCVVFLPDVRLNDDDNLIRSSCLLYTKRHDLYMDRREDLTDILKMLAQLARKVDPSQSSRINNLMKDFVRVQDVTSEEKAAQATQIVNDFAECFRLVMCAWQSLPTEEAEAAKPTRPRSKQRNSYGVNARDRVEVDANALSKTKAFDRHRRIMGNLNLMPPPNAKPGTPHPMRLLADFINRMVEDIANGKPQPDMSDNMLDYDKLRCVLSVDPCIRYEKITEKDNAIECKPVCEEPEEYRLKKAIVDDLDRYLKKARAFAKSRNSLALADLERCLPLEEAYEGCFFAKEGDEKGAAQAEGDLDEFIAALKRIRKTLCIGHKVPKQDFVEEIKEHVTVQSDRIIAAKAPKRKKKFGHEGNGLKGKKTTTMQQQLMDFETWLATHPISKKYPLGTRAHQFWNEDKNKKAYDKAATATGEKHGYKDYTKLARAARDKGWR